MTDQIKLFGILYGIDITGNRVQRYQVNAFGKPLEVIPLFAKSDPLTKKKPYHHDCVREKGNFYYKFCFSFHFTYNFLSKFCNHEGVMQTAADGYHIEMNPPPAAVF